jgi:hypothetical protein
MRPADLVTFCRGLPHATEDVKWGKDCSAPLKLDHKTSFLMVLRSVPPVA